MYKQEQYLQDLEELINIDCGTYNPKGVEAVVEILESTFKRMNFYTERFQVSDVVGPLFVACNKLNVEYYDVLLVGHCDTVYEDGLAQKHKMRIEGNKVYGLGSIDMKSGILNGIYALNSLSKEELEALSVCFILNPDEEISSIYSGSKILEFAKKAKCALVLESPGKDGLIVNSRKGIAGYNVKFTGKSAHASTPKQGASAINELANFIIKLGGLENEALKTTYNVSPIKGGSSAGNVIAAEAELNFEMRFLSAEDYQVMLDKVNSFVKTPINSEVKIQLTQISYKAPLKNYDSAKWIEELAMVSAKKVGLNVSLHSSGGGSDGNEISKIGIPVIDGLGPVGAYWHNADLECLFLDSVALRINFVKQILLDIIDTK